jgi:muramoyltetrapeptide carboxypeptidase
MVVSEMIVPVGIFAASSVVPQIEFGVGIEHLKAHGFEPRVESQVSAEHFIFAGSDDERALSLYRLAVDPALRILWAARGGYGAARLVPLLERLTRERGAPPAGKLLVGYSDVTVLHEFVRRRWNWHTLHAPMPAAGDFSTFDRAEWDAIVHLVRGEKVPIPWENTELQWLTDRPESPIRAPLIGGNLSLWASMAGTSVAAPGRGKFLFFEDIGEAIYRIDRMVTQLAQSGAFDGASAIILGDFTNCNDENNQCLANRETRAKKPLRTVYEQAEAFARIFGDVGRRLGIPIAHGLPVGHGGRYSPLPLGATYELSPAGKLSLLQWDWLSYNPPRAATT